MPLSLAFGDGLICGPDLMRIVDPPLSSVPDRRRRVRLKLSWTVYVWTDRHTKPIEGRTRDVSSEGFYCFVSAPIQAGEDVAYTIMMPTFNADGGSEFICLEGHGKVVRLESLPAGTYGIACHIRDYNVLPPRTAP
jgi:hypothetical protein